MRTKIETDKQTEGQTDRDIQIGRHIDTDRQRQRDRDR